PTYVEIIDWWKKLDALSPMVKMQAMGTTDAGFPLHLILVSATYDFDIKGAKAKNKSIIFINNGIHPGEPDGIDASMLLVRDIVENKYKLPTNLLLAFLPVYNIGGALNRSKNYRVDQNGPEEFGFRGNSQNYDLNRDFIKGDTKEGRTFIQIFQSLDPDVFVDNHVSNGADYQHIMTLLTTQHNKLGGELGNFLNQQFEPGLYTLMKEKGFDLVPYVNHFGATPDKGWSEFWDSPRYSSGYAALWSTFAFVPETHMLKPYDQRVKATYALMQSFIEFTSKNNAQIRALREATKKAQISQSSFPIAWKWDRTKSVQIPFKGYEAGQKTSLISGLPRLFYDRNKPININVPFYNTYVDSINISKPKAYIIPQGWWKVIELLKVNGVKMDVLKRDTTIEVEAYRIEKYTASPRPFEGHHVNSGNQISTSLKKIYFRKGDYYIPMNQAANRFLMETLEPQGEDSYFAWNFFDPILGQKEGFSDYVFEETAAQYLANNPTVKTKLEERRATDTSFAKSASAQLNFIFQSSPYYEAAHMQYPVYRLLK
ncbi:MAG TPA: M14 family metallopeptidase, partial [Chitinophagaceae bacterium]|nr:M14 family metallopeptidase [Chitinophagaceae bacterium]